VVEPVETTLGPALDQTARATLGHVITLELAERLRDAGLAWAPASGDRFAIPDRDLDGQVFVISEMTIETQQLTTGRVVKFNGTTEWALDSIAQNDVVWLPHEAQLRDLIGSAFRKLEPAGDGYAVEAAAADGTTLRELDVDAERAYARVLLALMG
jgi:hypothetical protein